MFPQRISWSTLSLISLISLPVFAADYTAHEWGTFTSVQGSDGIVLEGMNHSDTELPDFVYGRSKLQPSESTESLNFASDIGRGGKCHKCLDFSPVAGTALSINQKMETPVIYFYSQNPQHVSVQVNFPNGIISQYYPNASSFFPPIGAVSALTSGRMNWEVDISNEKLPLPEVGSTSDWQFSRNVNSNLITANGENEKLIFYRGVGQFFTPVQIVSKSPGIFELSNSSTAAVPAAFYLQVSETGGRLVSLGAVSQDHPIEIVRATNLLKMEEYLPKAMAQVAQALVESGLYEDEAQAMVNTWKDSYFKTSGSRILYVLPRSWTDNILPLQMNPTPRCLVRTLVGRVEMMGLDEEAGILARLKAGFAIQDSGTAELVELGRFAEPKLRRIQQLATAETPEFQAYLQKLVDLASIQN